MSLYTTIQLHNVAAGREDDYARWFDGAHQQDLARLRGFRSADRYEVTPQQIMPDIPQPWRFLSVYEFDYAAPEIDLPALAPLLADARDAGLKDAVIINTCAVTNEAVRSSRYAVRKAKKDNPDAHIIVTGCAAQIDPKAFAATQ